MKLPARARWVLYTLLLLLAAAAVLAPEAKTPVELVQAVVRSQVALPAPVAAAESGLVLPLSRGLSAPIGDPFSAPRSTVAEAAAAPQPAASPARAPGAPPLPFVFLGRWQEQGRSFVFLQRGDRSYKVEQPGPLDADYAVLALGEHAMRLRYEPLGLEQELRFDAAPAATQPARAPAAQAAAPAPAPAPDPDTSEN